MAHEGSPTTPESEESEVQRRFRELDSAIADRYEELASSFSEEFEGFESIRVTLEGSQCIRLSRVEEVDGGKRVSRLTFRLGSSELDGEPRFLVISCKGIIFNRERGHEELELDLRADLPMDDADPLLTQAREFAEREILAFASAYETARASLLRPIS